MNCSDTWKVILDDGDYSIEAAIDGGKGEAKFSVGAGKPNRLIIDLSNLNHEEEIKADSPEEVVVVPATPKKAEKKSAGVTKSKQEGKVTIGGLEIKGISEKDAAELQKAAALLQMLGGLTGKPQNAPAPEQASQKPSTQKADKEFEEMSKELDMYTK
jgi:hypothetical protein